MKKLSGWQNCTLLAPEIRSGAARIASAFTAAGFQLFLVGGAVRDIVSGKRPEDVDLLTTATPDEAAEIFPEIKLTGASFGVMRLKEGGTTFEIASAREERNYMDGRHPGEIRCTRDPDVDAMRRDFTINAMRLDPLSGELFDPAGGLEDLRRGIIRTVGDPEKRFKEDYLRMLRAIRFAAKTGFELEEKTFDALCKFSFLAAELAGERIREELTRILTGKHPDRALRLLLETGLLKAVLPEAAALSGVTQPPEYHPEGDVFEHICLMFKHMAYPDPQLAWSVLLHDIGKPVTRSVEPGGRIRFFCHEERGAEMVREIAERLHFSLHDRESIARAVRNHMRMASVREMKTAKLKKLMADDNFSLELELHRLDCISCHSFMDTFVFLTDKLCCEPDPALPPRWVMGKDLVKAGVPPSPAFKTVLEETFDRQLSGEFNTPEEALIFALNQLQERK